MFFSTDLWEKIVELSEFLSPDLLFTGTFNLIFGRFALKI
jgi:hypothetical protein